MAVGISSVWGRVILGRLAQAVLVAWAVATLVFFMLEALPGEAALRVVIARLGAERVTDAAIARAAAEAGLAAPMLERYGAWILGTLRFDFGHSLVSGQPVAPELWRHGQHTLTVGLAGWLLSYLLAIPAGVLAGLRPGGVIDRLVLAAATALAATPAFLLGLGLMSLFALTLGWLPAAGSGTLAHVLLPAVTLALALTATSARIVRHAVVETRSAFFPTYARVLGASNQSAVLRHSLPNVAVPLVAYASVQLALVLDGFLVIETLFAYPGIGDLLVKALLAHDVPVIQAVAVTIGFAFALLGLVADLATLAIDPRLRRPVAA